MRTVLTKAMCLGFLIMTALSDGSYAAQADLSSVGANQAHGGFLFYCGEFIPPPYEVTQEGTMVHISGRRAGTVSGLTEAVPQRRNRGREGRRYVGPVEAVRRFLGQGGTLIVWDDAPPLALERFAQGVHLLKALDPDADRNTALSELARSMPREARTGWARLLASDLEVTPELLKLSRQEFALIEKIEHARAKAEAAQQRLQAFTFPLAACGMLLTAVAAGHLIRSAMANEGIGATGGDVRVIGRLATRSMGLVVAMSLLDLTWSHLALQAGEMLELNPIGRRLAEVPLNFAAFKIGLTALAVGLVYFLRHHRAARLAAWWICFIMTLITVRWLSFGYLAT